MWYHFFKLARCVAVDQRPGKLLRQFDCAGGDNMFTTAKRFESLFRHRRIHFDYGHRFASPLPATQVKMADIDLMSPQDRSYATNNTRHITIARYQHVTVRNCFDMKAIDLSYATIPRLPPKTEQRARHSLFARASDYRCGNGRNQIGSRTQI